MNLSEVCIRRPVFTIVLSILIVVFGAVGFVQLGVREYPAVDPPVVSVRTDYSGANPELIDSQITEPLEAAISSVPGIRTLSSTSREGSSQIRVEFTLDSDLEAAANDVRDKVSQAVRQLPADADPPSVDKADATSDPIIFLALQSDARSILDVSNFADTVIKERLQTIPGVSAIRIFGERRYAMRLLLDPERLAAHRVTPSDVFAAVRAQNVDLPTGRVEGVATELSLRTDGRLMTRDEFENLVVFEENGRQVLLRDVGRAELSAQNLRGGNLSKEIPMIGVAVVPQPNTNAIEIADEFFRRFELIKREIPPDMHVDIGYDFTRFVRRSIFEVRETLMIAFSLVALIILLFLRDWRTVLIPIIAIPISLISAFFIMWLMDYSINVLTLVGLVLSIGLVCDDAIVVLENIFAKVEAGYTPLRAALDGSREIYFAVISTTITLVVVFIPVIFLSGLTGRLFREFGVVVVGSVIVSAFVALTLSPMMARFLLKPSHSHGLFYRLTEPIFVLINKIYAWTLNAFLRIRLITIPILCAVTFAIIWYGSELQSELAPMEDRSNARISVRAPEGASFDYTSRQIGILAGEIEKKYAEDIHRVFAISGGGFGSNASNSGTIILYFKEPSDRKRNVFDLVEDITKDVDAFTPLRGSISMPPSIGDRRAGLPVQYVIQAPNLESMQEILPQFIEEASKNPAFRFVDSDLKTNRPQLDLSINRSKAAELGVTVESIARALQLTFGDARYAYFILNGRQYDVIGQLDRVSRNDPMDLDRVHVRSRGGELIPLSSLLTSRETVSPAALYRFNRYISATISAGLNPGYSLGDGIKAMRDTGDKILPPNFSSTLSGQSRDFEESSSSLLYAFLLALALIYLVLAAQFESWIDPFVIMFTVPLSLVGAVIALKYMGQTLNVFSQIGIIMLVGLVTKNGILIVEFANQKKAQGLSVYEAARQAAISRFRPILMTSLSTILGITPIAIALGGAAESRRSLGIAVIGGMLIATLLTIYVVPAMYAMLSSEKAGGIDVEESLPEDSSSDTPAKTSQPIEFAGA
jgi:multidrug efflux pump